MKDSAGVGVYPSMDRTDGRVNKVKHLFKEIGAPRRLHRFGPKIYELWQHVFALFIKANCRLSYRRTTSFLKSLGFKVATKSTLQRYAAKLLLPFWQKLLRLSAPEITELVSLDGTSLERTRASNHYIHRIGREKSYYKGFHFSILVGENSKILSLRLRKNHGSDVKDVKSVFKDLKQKPKIAIMDKCYDAEWIHEFLENQEIHSIAPTRKNARKGFYRKKLKKSFPQQLYNKRSRVESIFHAFKQKYGSSVSSHKITSARSEVYCKAILHNLFLKIISTLGTNPLNT